VVEDHQAHRYAAALRWLLGAINVTPPAFGIAPYTSAKGMENLSDLDSTLNHERSITKRNL
jgi:hypothetical protein